MEQILIGVLSGVVTAVILGLCFYHKIESTMEQKMHKYAEALLKFQGDAADERNGSHLRKGAAAWVRCGSDRKGSF